MIGRDRDRYVLLIAAGFTIWLTGLAVLYGVNAIGCKLDWQAVTILQTVSLQRTVVVAIFAAHVAALVLFFILVRKNWGRAGAAGLDRPERFVKRITEIGLLAALASTVFAFFGVFWLTQCAAT